jgi:hypothetical protein
MTARRPGPVTAAGLAVVVASTVFRWWSQREAWYHFDDFNFAQRAALLDLDPGYLLNPYNGHLMPAGNLLIWLDTRLAPLDYRLVAAQMLVLFALAAVGMLRALTTLFGQRWGVVPPLVMFCFSPILIPVTTWWAAGVNLGPVLVAVTWGVASHVAWHRAPSGRGALRTLAWILFGLAFAELGVLTYVFLAHVSLAYFSSGSVRERVTGLWQEHRRLLAAHAALLATYLATYATLAMNFDVGEITERPMFGVAQDLVGVSFAVSLVGGPTRWAFSDFTQSEADPPQLVLLLGWTVLLVLLHASLTTRRRAARAWLLPASLLVVSVALISVSRAIYFGPQIALDYRFQTLVAPATALALGLAFLPVVGAVESAERVRAHGLVDRRGWVVAGLVVFVAVSTVSTARYPQTHLPPGEDARSYFDRVLASSRGLPEDVVLLDLAVPPRIWLGPWTNAYSHMFAPVRGRTPPAATVVTDDPYLVDPSGRVRPAALDVARRGDPPDPDATCPWRVGTDRVRVELDGPVYGYVWWARLDYVAPADGTMRVAVGDRERDIPVLEGAHEVWLPAPGDYTELRLRSEEEPGPCVTGVSIGAPRPEEP